MYIATFEQIPENIGKLFMGIISDGKYTDVPLLPMNPLRKEEVIDFWQSKGETLDQS